MASQSLVRYALTCLAVCVLMYVGQAHLWAGYSPDLARQIRKMSQSAENAGWLFGFKAIEVRRPRPPILCELALMYRPACTLGL